MEIDVNIVNNEKPVNSEIVASVNIVNRPQIATPVPVVNSPVSSISLKKIENIESETPHEKHNISGYRLIDTEVLSYIFSMLLCPKCEQFTILLGEHVSRKKGLSSLLFLKCCNCNFNHGFYTSLW